MSGPCQMPTEIAGINNLGAVQNVADEVRECNQRLTKAAARADSTALSDCYDADARFIAAGTPTVVGKDGIGALCSDFLRADRSTSPTELMRSGPIVSSCAPSAPSRWREGPCSAASSSTAVTKLARCGSSSTRQFAS